MTKRIYGLNPFENRVTFEPEPAVGVPVVVSKSLREQGYV